MIQTRISLREDQKEQLKKEYKETGIRFAETVRRALDKYFQEKKK